MNKPVTFLFTFAAICLLFVAPGGVKAQDLKPPQLVLQEASDKMLNALIEYKSELEQTSEKIFPLVEEILIPHFDFKRMSRLALGRSWKDATQEQQQRFVDEFRMLLVRTYATAMLQYTDEEFRFMPFHDDLSKRRVDVPIQVIRRGAPNVPVAISMFQNNEGEWKVYDVKIEGVSLVTTYRSTFNRDIRNEGIEKLIESISKRNRKASS